VTAVSRQTKTLHAACSLSAATEQRSNDDRGTAGQTPNDCSSTVAPAPRNVPIGLLDLAPCAKTRSLCNSLARVISCFIIQTQHRQTPQQSSERAIWWNLLLLEPVELAVVRACRHRMPSLDHSKVFATFALHRRCDSHAGGDLGRCFEREQ